MRRYARGKWALGECRRSGRKMFLKDMVRDGYYRNLIVDPVWYEPEHPQEHLPSVEDPEALWRPAPEQELGSTDPVLSITISTGPDTCDLTWTEATQSVSQIEDYTLFRSVQVGAGNPFSDFTLIATLEVQRAFDGGIIDPSLHTAFTDTSVDFSTEVYRYRVDANPIRVGEANSPQQPPGRSNVVTCGAQPSVVTLTGTKVGDDIQLDWTVSTSGLNPLFSYCIFRSVNGGAFVQIQEVLAPTLTYTDTDVENPPNTYDYFVIAKDTVGVESDPSNIVSFGLTDPLFVAVADGGSAGFRAMTSIDGINWVLRSTPADDQWQGLSQDTRNGGLWVAVANNARVMTSPDGIVWTLRAAPAGDFRDVAFSPDQNIFAAVGAAGLVMTSPDGITWTTRTTPGTANILWETVIWNDFLDLFVAGSQANGGVGNIMTSPDGITWTHRTTPVSQTTDIAFNPANGRMVTANRADVNNMWSTDAINWNLVTPNGLPGGMTSITYDQQNSQYVVVTLVGPVNQAGTSPDGITWTQRSTPARSWESVAFSPRLNRLIATAVFAGGNAAMDSVDGITWNQRTTPDAADPGAWDNCQQGATPVV